MATKKPFNWWLWTKMLVGGGAIAVGGPLLTMRATPTEEELFKRYNPELQRKSLEGRHQKEQEFDDFVANLKRQAKSNKPLWTVQAEEAESLKQAKNQEVLRLAEEAKARKDEIRREAGLPAQPVDKQK